MKSLWGFLNKPILPGLWGNIVFVLLVLAVLSILSSLCPCSCTMGVSEKERRIHCLNNLKSIGQALNFYAADHWENKPAKLSDITRYADGDKYIRWFMCPSAIRRLEKYPPNKFSELINMPEFSSYDYLSATGMVEGFVPSTIEPVMCDKSANHDGDGINILFADGHVSWWQGTIEDYARSNSLIITVNTNWLN